MTEYIKVRTRSQLAHVLEDKGVTHEDAQIASKQLWKNRKGMLAPVFKAGVNLPDTLVVDPKSRSLVSTPRFPTGDVSGLHAYSLKAVACSPDHYEALDAAAISALRTPSACG